MLPFINIQLLVKNCTFYPGCSIGAKPQDLKFVGEKSYTVIGDGGSFRECRTVNRGAVKKPRPVSEITF